MPPRHGVRERAAIDVLELPADRNTVCNTACGHAAGPYELGQKVGRGLPFDGRIGSQDHLAHPIGVEQGFKFARAELLGPDAVER